jgi:putative oxidoreductase
MASAIAGVHWPKGLWNQNGGIEFPLVMGTVGFLLAVIGPGALSLDHVLGIDRHGLWWGLGALGLGILGGVLSLVPRHMRRGQRNQRLREAA